MRPSVKILLISMLGLFGFLSGCAVKTFLQDFHGLRIGMDKSDVLDKLGTPNFKDHRDDKDWWYYSGYDEGKHFDKMIVFKNEQLIYAGRVAKPPNVKEASKADQENQAENEALARDQEKTRAKASPIVGPPSPIEDQKPEN